MANLKIYLWVILASIILIGLMMIVPHYMRDIKIAHEALKRWSSQVAETSCGAIEYARAGEGYPVLVAHGAFGGYDQGMISTEYLTSAGFQIIAISRSGYLGSPIPATPDLNRQSETYACLLDELGIQQAVIYGISGGASSALRFATRYPERTVVLVLQSPAAPGDIIPASPPKAALSVMGSDLKIQAPALVVHSLDDPRAIPENVIRLADLIPNAHRFALPDGGHLLLGHGAEIRAEVTQFLRSNLPVLEGSR